MLALAAAIAVGLGVGLLGVKLAAPHLPNYPLAEGVTIDGAPVPGSDPRAWLQERDEEHRARKIWLQHGELRHETTVGELGGGIDVEATLRRAAAIAHTGSLRDRLAQVAAARRGEIDVPYEHTFDAAAALRVIEPLAASLSREPEDAEIDLANHRKIPDVSGQELDRDRSLAEIEQGVHASEVINLVAKTVPARVTLNDLADLDVSKVLAAYETRFAVGERGRSANVLLAARLLNGTIMRPNETISFNDRVGPRTLARGFERAPEIVGDELTIGVGGGTCQVSSTLHGAALYGGLSMVQRKSHSRPSSYTLLGLDATVAYPIVDLKIQNPYRFSIIVHAFTPKPGLLRVELLGGEAVENVDYKYGISGIEKYQRRITVKSWLEPGRMFRKQRGTRGMDVFSYVKLKFKDGRTEERRYFSGYRATPEVFWVAPDVRQDALPPLPEHAKGVEGRADNYDDYDG